VERISRIGMDTSRHVFQLHAVNAAEVPVLRKKLRRKEMVAFFEKLLPTVIAIEACGASHHWARLLQSLGHTVKLIAPQLVKPYVKRGKNDAADAEALCEAMSRPTMRFVPVKTTEQQATLMLAGVRDRLIRNRTQLSNAIRGHAAEFGLTGAKGMAHLVPLLERIGVDESLPTLARDWTWFGVVMARGIPAVVCARAMPDIANGLEIFVIALPTPPELAHRHGRTMSMRAVNAMRFRQ
jgi:transposase